MTPLESELLANRLEDILNMTKETYTMLDENETNDDDVIVVAINKLEDVNRDIEMLKWIVENHKGS